MTTIATTLTLRLGLLALLLLGPAAAHAQAEPAGVVRATVDAVIAVLKDDALDRVERRDAIRKLMHQRFDFERMCRSVLARNWRDATPAQQQRFIELFPELLLHTYMTGLEGYTDEVVEIEDTRMKGRAKAIVETSIISGGKAIPVSYRLVERDGDWQVYDVVVEGVSLVNNYRGSFGSTIKKDGMDQLLDDLVAKIDELRKPTEG